MQAWEDVAKALPYGASEKFLHCGSSAAARVYNSPKGISLHCFRCGERLFKSHGARSPAEILAAREATVALQEARAMPDRAIHLTDPTCPSEALLWPLRTGLVPEEASGTYGMRYDPVTRRVLIPLDGGFLARAIYGDRPKYLKAGATTVTYYELKHAADRVVVTEDILSTIKVYRAGFSALAILGTSISPVVADKIASYAEAISWTDGDKAGDAAFVKLRKRLRLYDVRLSRIRTDKDPKELHLSDIQQLIKERNT